MRRPDDGCTSVHQFFNVSSVCSTLADCNAEDLCRVCSGGSGWSWAGVGSCVCNGTCETGMAVIIRAAEGKRFHEKMDRIAFLFMLHVVSLFLIGIVSRDFVIPRAIRVALCSVSNFFMFASMGIYVNRFGVSFMTVVFFAAWFAYDVFLTLIVVICHERRASSLVRTDPPSDETDVCAVCLYRDGEWVTLEECHHAFHQDCVERWLEAGKGCPICRVKHFE